MNRLVKARYSDYVGTETVAQDHPAYGDHVLCFEQGRALFDAAPDVSHNGIGKTFVELTDTGHNDVMYVAADQVERAVSDFLAQLRE